MITTQSAWLSYMKDFFLSLKTTVWTLLILVCLFFLGTYMMPMHRETFAPMNEGILFDWVRETALDFPGQTWWFFASLAGLMLLTTNTIVCSFQAIRGQWSRTDFLVRIAPQVIHIGFLLILLAHLLSSGWGYKLSGMMPEGAAARLPENRVLHLSRIEVQTDSSGYMTDWTAQVAVFENETIVQSGVLAPNRPVFYRGVAIYLKNLNFERGPAAHIMIVRDPGPVWALLGSVLFLAGSVVLLVLKWKRT